MEVLRNNNFENSLVICNKDESHKSFIELLFESKKRSGGDDIIELTYDKLLKQYLIVYENPDTVKRVLEFGPVCFNSESYVPKQIDKSKLILENIDDKLEKDILDLYADSLLQDVDNCEFKTEILKPGYVMLICNKEFDIDRVKKRHLRHSKLQKKDVLLHTVAKLDINYDVSFKTSEYYNFYLDILSNNKSISLANQTTPSLAKVENKISKITVIQETNETANKTSVQESLGASNVSNSEREIILQEKIKNLESKLCVYENLNSNLNRINKLTECAMKLDSAPENSGIKMPVNNSKLSSDLPNQVALVKQAGLINNQGKRERDETGFAQNLNIKVNRFEFDNSDSPIEYPRTNNNLRLIQKYLVEEHRRYGQNSPSRDEEDQMSNIVPCKLNKTSKNLFNKQNQHHNNFNCLSHSASTPMPFSSFFTPLQRINSSQLNTSMINRFPIIKFQKPKSLTEAEIDMKSELETGENSKIELADERLNINTRCSICLEDLVENDEVRILSCFHQFHVKCIDTWLAQKSTCPTCKFNLFSTLNSD